MPICRRLETQAVFRLLSRADASAGSSNAARMAIMAITTSNSTRVKARRLGAAAVIRLASRASRNRTGSAWCLVPFAQAWHTTRLVSTLQGVPRP